MFVLNASLDCISMRINKMRNDPFWRICISEHRNRPLFTTAETFSHEGYGHALIYVRTNGNRNMAIHHSLLGFREGNQLLIDYSIKARKETFMNMSK